MFKIHKMSKNRIKEKQPKKIKLKNVIFNKATSFYISKNNKIVAKYINQTECAKDFNLNHVI